VGFILTAPVPIRFNAKMTDEAYTGNTFVYYHIIIILILKENITIWNYRNFTRAKMLQNTFLLCCQRLATGVGRECLKKHYELKVKFSKHCFSLTLAQQVPLFQHFSLVSLFLPKQVYFSCYFYCTNNFCRKKRFHPIQNNSYYIQFKYFSKTFQIVAS
jgi:hypothetical protein